MGEVNDRELIFFIPLRGLFYMLVAPVLNFLLDLFRLGMVDKCKSYGPRGSSKESDDYWTRFLDLFAKDYLY